MRYQNSGKFSKLFKDNFLPAIKVTLGNFSLNFPRIKKKKYLKTLPQTRPWRFKFDIPESWKNFKLLQRQFSICHQDYMRKLFPNFPWMKKINIWSLRPDTLNFDIPRSWKIFKNFQEQFFICRQGHMRKLFPKLFINKKK